MTKQTYFLFGILVTIGANRAYRVYEAIRTFDAQAAFLAIYTKALYDTVTELSGTSQLPASN